MTVLNRENVIKLMTNSHNPSISLYIPTHSVGPEKKQNRIRFKNATDRAEKLLKNAGMEAYRSLLEPVYQVPLESESWDLHAETLAIFSSQDIFSSFKLPFQCPAEEILGPHFNIKPLIRFLMYDRPFYILALSQNDVRLFQSTFYETIQMDVKELSEDLTRLFPREKEKKLQFHTGSSGSSGKKNVLYHGQGAGKDDNNVEISKLFRVIDQIVVKTLHGENAPLIIAAVEYLHPLYKEVNSYQNICDPGVIGNPDELSGDELQFLAKEIIDQSFEQSVNQEYNNLLSLQPKEKASTDDETIIKAAAQGRVKSLFVDQDAACFGVFDEKTQDVTCLNDEAEPGMEDLCNFAAIKTILQGGAVYLLPEKHKTSKMAAIFRY